MMITDGLTLIPVEMPDPVFNETRLKKPDRQIRAKNDP
jgi:hypothetical protein